MAGEFTLTPINSRYSVLHSPVANFNMCLLGDYPYHIFPTVYILTSAIGLEKSGVTTVQSNTNLSLHGQGVLIGFIDSGINYRHEAFLNRDGSTRIFSIWDQTIESDLAPIGFDFGTEYSKTMINAALQSPEPLSIVPSVDEIGHGTMMAGIAAGSKNEEKQFSGVVQESELVVVKLAQTKSYNRKIFFVPDDTPCYPETNILLGIEYLKNVAERLSRPLVICIGLGSSQGEHDGHSALTLYLNTIATLPKISVCVAAGNEGNNRRHYHGSFSPTNRQHSFELHIGPSDPHLSLEIWQNSPNRLSLEVISPTGETVQNIAPTFSECRKYNFIFETSQIYINNILLEEESGDQLILLRFENALNGIWTIRMINNNDFISSFDAWLPAGDIISSETYFTSSTPYTTITTPGDNRNAVTVTAYNQTDNSILPNASRGYSANNQVEPDIAAPGYCLLCPSHANTYTTASGTGAAAAHTAGVIAMLMEWAVLRGNYTTITGRDICRLLIRGAKRDNNLIYPNHTWGYGQLDIYGLFRSLM